MVVVRRRSYRAAEVGWPAEQKVKAWETRYALINQLAHELNNPLAAMTFTLHLLGTHNNLPDNTISLLDDARIMLDRISDTVRRVLEEVHH